MKDASEPQALPATAKQGVVLRSTAGFILAGRASEPGEWRRGDFHVVSATLFNAGERFILVQPFSGWLVGLLDRMGPGTIYRLAYTVPDVRAAYARLLAKGIVPVDESLAPLPEDRITSPAGYDILWLPPNEASPSVELLDRAACEAAMARTAARAR